MRVLMTGGGTGGHVYPAIAIANTIRGNLPGSVIEFVGTARGIENRLAGAEGYKVRHVEVMGIKRSLSPANIRAFYLALVSPRRAERIIDDFRPDVVIGTGGYVCWPLLVAAARRGVPCAVHESNVKPGAAVMRLQKYVDRIFINFRETEKFLGAKDKVMHVGNPLRGAFGVMSRQSARSELGMDRNGRYILSYGGSLGAEPINAAVLEMMRDCISKRSGIYHTHASGAAGCESARAVFAEYGLQNKTNLELLEYINDMPVRMAAADVVISRAGAMTISELASLRKAAVLIPSPYVTDNQQYRNARVLADAGAAVLLEERELSGARLAAEVSELLDNPAKRAAMEGKIASFAEDDANKIIFNEIVRLSQTNG